MKTYTCISGSSLESSQLIAKHVTLQKVSLSRALCHASAII